MRNIGHICNDTVIKFLKRVRLIVFFDRLHAKVITIHDRKIIKVNEEINVLATTR